MFSQHKLIRMQFLNFAKSCDSASMETFIDLCYMFLLQLGPDLLGGKLDL